MSSHENGNATSETINESASATKSETTASASMKSKQQVLKSIIEAKTPKLKLNEIEMTSCELSDAVFASKSNGNGNGNDDPNNSHKLSEYYSNKKNAARSLSMDGEDTRFNENVLFAKDRRTSWQQVRSQKSFVPSLSAICKLICNF
jgi:hypothetical protein